MRDITKALSSLRPGAKWSMTGNVYENIQWLDTTQTKPTKIEIESELDILEKQQQDTEYQRLRKLEYPPVADYLDAVVKGDLVGQQAYIDACLAVKAKYPKPEGS
jgi:hypothetical protein